MFLRLNDSSVMPSVTPSVTNITSNVTGMASNVTGLTWSLANVTANGTILKDNSAALLRHFYDSYGAMLFIAVVICFYASSILLFICWNQRWNQAHDNDRQISQYLKAAKDLDTKVAEEYVLKFRSMLLASSVIAHGNRMMVSRNQRLIRPLLGPRDSDVGFNDTEDPEDAVDDTLNGCDYPSTSNGTKDPCNEDNHRLTLYRNRQDVDSQSHDFICDNVGDDDSDNDDNDDRISLHRHDDDHNGQYLIMMS